MPLFNFNAPASGSITTSRFWIFWASTIPVTLLVLLAYAAYVAAINRKREKEDADSDMESETDAKWDVFGRKPSRRWFGLRRRRRAIELPGTFTMDDLETTTTTTRPLA